MCAFLCGLRGLTAVNPSLGEPDSSERTEPRKEKQAEIIRARKLGVRSQPNHGGVSSRRPKAPLPRSSAPSLPPGPQVPGEEGVRLGAHDLRAGLEPRTLLAPASAAFPPEEESWYCSPGSTACPPQEEAWSCSPGLSLPTPTRSLVHDKKLGLRCPTHSCFLPT